MAREFRHKDIRVNYMFKIFRAELVQSIISAGATNLKLLLEL